MMKNKMNACWNSFRSWTTSIEGSLSLINLYHNFIIAFIVKSSQKPPHKNEYCSYCSAFSQNKSIEKSKYIFFTIFSIRNSKFNIEENKQLITKKQWNIKRKQCYNNIKFLFIFFNTLSMLSIRCTGQ